MKTFIQTLFVKAIFFSTAALVLAACQTVQTTQGGTVGVARQQKMAVSAEEIDQSAREQYRQVIAEQEKKGQLNRNAAQVSRVRAVASRLIAPTAVFRPDAPRWGWEINVINSPEVNAWCMPGGKIAVYTGLIEKLNITDDELAAVLGHEIAHALREHARERASEQMGAGVIAAGIDMLGSLYGIEGTGKLANAGFQLGMGLPHSRQQETEADRIGVELAARAGYNPQAAVTLWQKMGQVGGSEPIKFLSTHPQRDDRQRDLQEYAERVMPLYEQARR